jgi:Potassium-transporting ATPase A subunit
VAQAPRGGGKADPPPYQAMHRDGNRLAANLRFHRGRRRTDAPLGGHLARVYGGKNTVLRFLFGPLERGIYRVAGIDPKAGQGWKTYAISFLAFHALGIAGMYAVLRLQPLLLLNPAGFDAVPPDLALNTAVSFVTNQLAVLWRRNHAQLSQPDDHKYVLEHILRPSIHPHFPQVLASWPEGLKEANMSKLKVT